MSYSKKPNRPRSLDDMDLDAEAKAGDDERDMTPSQLNTRIPAYLHYELRKHKLEERETIEEAVRNALEAYLSE